MITIKLIGGPLDGATRSIAEDVDAYSYVTASDTWLKIRQHNYLVEGTIGTYKGYYDSVDFDRRGSKR